jgi:hypothetical protein
MTHLLSILVRLPTKAPHARKIHVIWGKVRAPASGERACRDCIVSDSQPLTFPLQALLLKINATKSCAGESITLKLSNDCRDAHTTLAAVSDGAGSRTSFAATVLKGLWFLFCVYRCFSQDARAISARVRDALLGPLLQLHLIVSAAM